MEAVRHVSRTGDSEAVSLLAKSLAAAKGEKSHFNFTKHDDNAKNVFSFFSDDFFDNSRCDFELAKSALRVLAAFASSSGSKSAKSALKHILDRQPREYLPMITL